MSIAELPIKPQIPLQLPLDALKQRFFCSEVEEILKSVLPFYDNQYLHSLRNFIANNWKNDHMLKEKLISKTSSFDNSPEKLYDSKNKEWYPPKTRDYLSTAIPSEQYLDLCFIYLQNAFSYLPDSDIKTVMTANNNRLTPTFDKLSKELIMYQTEFQIDNIKKPYRVEEFVPVKVNYEDDPSFLEEAFCLEYQLQKDQSERNLLISSELINQAIKHSDMFVQCIQCNLPLLSDEVILPTCNNKKHSLCQNCLNVYIQNKISKFTLSITCDQCSTPYDLSKIKKFLTPQTIATISSHFCQYNLQTSKANNIHKCPKCSHVSSTFSEKYFCCQNPACKKIICLYCDEEYHPEKVCDILSKLRREFLVNVETKMIENGSYPCPHCHRFVAKDNGCNCVTCDCGKVFCWNCGNPTTADHSHFKGFGGSEKLWMDDADREKWRKKRVAAGKEAVDKWKQLHPDYASKINLPDYLEKELYGK